MLKRLTIALLFGFLSASSFAEEKSKRPPEIDIWYTIAKMPEGSDKAPPEIKALLGKKITIAGFAIVNEMFKPGEVKEFLMTPMAGGCVHVPPPPPNYVLMVKVKPGKKTDVPMYDWLQVTGTLEIPKDKKDRAAFAFVLNADAVTVFSPKM